MNYWFGMVSENGRDTQILVRYITPFGNYGILLKTVHSLSVLFTGYRVPALDLDTQFKIDNHYVIENYGVIPKGTPKTKDGEYHKPAPQIVYKSLLEIWLEHPNKATYGKIIFDPRPPFLLPHVSQRDFNKWSGYSPGVSVFISAKPHTLLVLQRRGGKLYRVGSFALVIPTPQLHMYAVYRDHLTRPPNSLFFFAGCDNDEEFCYLIKKWAQKFQLPWLKQEVADAIGGKVRV